MQEAEFQKFVAETIKGITANQKKKKHSNGSFLLEQYVMENMVHGQVKCFKALISCLE